MKKIFSMALAGAMIAGLAATALAADYAYLNGPLTYSNDSKRMNQSTVEYGKAAYYQIGYGTVAPTTADLTAFTALDTYSDVEKLKVKAKWEMGADLVDSLSVVKKNISGNVAPDSTATPPVAGDTYLKDAGVKDYAYFLEIKLKPSTSVNDADVIGTITLTNSKALINGTGTAFKIDNEYDVAFTVFYKNTYASGSYEVVDGSDVSLVWDTNYAVKFDYDDEVSFVFGHNENGGENEGTFTVDVSGQGKLLINYNTKVDEAIAAANPTAIIRALNFNNVTFNRTGEFVYEFENGGYIYQVIDGQLYTMPNATFANDEYTFNTRTLGSYVFSNIELVNPEIVVETPEVEAPEVNPGTGAAV